MINLIRKMFKKKPTYVVYKMGKAYKCKSFEESVAIMLNKSRKVR